MFRRLIWAGQGQKAKFKPALREDGEAVASYSRQTITLGKRRTTVIGL